MDQIKIGKYIATKRKEKGLTQAELANMFSISDRAISKWENGISLPDSSIMIELSKTLGISVNELLLGEDVMENEKEKAEELLVELKKREEESYKIMLKMEYVLVTITLVFFFIVIIISMFTIKNEKILAVVMIVNTLLVMVACGFGLRLEQKAGFYVCKHCGHKYVPSYSQVFLAMHVGTTRYLKCPKCGKYSWNKKTTKVD